MVSELARDGLARHQDPVVDGPDELLDGTVNIGLGRQLAAINRSHERYVNVTFPVEDGMEISCRAVT
jgi:hypothetical protein